MEQSRHNLGCFVAGVTDTLELDHIVLRLLLSVSNQALSEEWYFVKNLGEVQDLQRGLFARNALTLMLPRIVRTCPAGPEVKLGGYFAVCRIHPN
jgi:hypothetical protein